MDFLHTVLQARQSVFPLYSVLVRYTRRLSSGDSQYHALATDRWYITLVLKNVS